jgi:anti-anti-sigma regulatory factor
MLLKIETKERFHEIVLPGPVVSAKLAAEWEPELTSLLEQEVKNVVMSLKQIDTMEPGGAEILLNTQTRFYDHSASFVFCEASEALEEQMEQMEILEQMNLTPTLSEAWDMVQMEEIERELMDDL